MFFRHLLKIGKTAVELVTLPSIKVSLCMSEVGEGLYDDFTQRHSKYFFIQKKTIGVALIKISDYINATDYIRTVNGKNSAAYFSRKATRAGYFFKPLNPNEYVNEIFEINTSAAERQGRPLDVAYYENILQYPHDSYHQYYGVFINEKLVAYQWIIYSGELALMNRIMGHAAHMKNGIMYLLVTSYVQWMIASEKNAKVIMYDTFFGARQGLKMFKSRCGFNPYKITWTKA